MKVDRKAQCLYQACDAKMVPERVTGGAISVGAALPGDLGRTDKIKITRDLI